MKICKTCGMEKEDTCFKKCLCKGSYFTRGSCNECFAKKRKVYNESTKEQRALWGSTYYKKNRDEINRKRDKKKRNHYERVRRTDEEKRKRINEQKRNWYRKNKTKCQEANMNYKKQNREKVNAHARLERAVKLGRIDKPARCQSCNEQIPLEGHHQDHSKWDKVIWLCKLCHAAIHRKLRESKENN